MRSPLWRIVFDPTFTSARKVKAQKTKKKSGKTQKNGNDDVADEH